MDITERLRALYVEHGTNYVQEAADEIERLRGVISEERTRLTEERDSQQRCAIRAMSYAELLEGIARAVAGWEGEPGNGRPDLLWWKQCQAAAMLALAKNPRKGQFDSGSLAEGVVATGAGSTPGSVSGETNGTAGTAVKASAESGAGATHSEFQSRRKCPECGEVWQDGMSECPQCLAIGHQVDHKPSRGEFEAWWSKEGFPMLERGWTPYAIAFAVWRVFVRDYESVAGKKS